MATRNLTMVIPYKRYNKGYSNPKNYEDYSCVNMYLHHDGYPEWQGVQLANWLKVNRFQDETRAAAKLVYDMYYDSCYLYDKASRIDHQYTYMVFVGENTRVVCYDNYNHTEIFDMTPDEILAKYADEMEYTRFDKGQTRYTQGKSDDVKYHSNKLLELLQSF
jgi:hypothetical protein